MIPVCSYPGFVKALFLKVHVMRLTKYMHTRSRILGITDFPNVYTQNPRAIRP